MISVTLGDRNLYGTGVPCQTQEILMLVDIDFDKCEGHGMCALVAPEVFAIDDEGGAAVACHPKPPRSAPEPTPVSCSAPSIRNERGEHIMM